MRLLILSSYLLAVSLIAWRRGGRPEQLIAGIMVVNIALDWVYHQIFGPSSFREIDPVHLAMDSVCFLLFLGVALRANRGWTMWVCAAQNIVMLGHLGKLLEVNAVLRGYWAMTQAPFYLQITLLAIGTLAHVLRVRAIGPYNSWRPDPSVVQRSGRSPYDERGELLAPRRR